MRRLKVTMDGQIAVLAVAEKGSFEAAGEYLGIGKSAVRKRVRSVDGELGTPVFRFAGNGMVPTDAGNIYLPVARESVRQASLGLGWIGCGHFSECRRTICALGTPAISM